ncbi:MAG: SAM-dependent methyltransferase [Burkholderiales bacterium]
MLNKWCAALVAALMLPAAAGAADKNPYIGPDFKSGGPYVPTPQLVVDEMLRLGNVGAKDYVMDLGSGDGIIVLTAGRKLGARGMGVDIDADLVKQSNAAAEKSGIADRVRFVQQDIFKVNLADASVVTLYLLPGMMLNLRPKLLAELKPGTRIVAHDYHFGEWDPDNLIELDVPEKEKVNGIPKAYLRLWIVPAKVQGAWQVKTAAAGGEPVSLQLKQQFQALDGTATVGGRAVKVTQARVRGEEVSFALPVDAKGTVGLFSGRLRGAGIEGTVEVPGRAPVAFTAARPAG